MLGISRETSQQVSYRDGITTQRPRKTLADLVAWDTTTSIRFISVKSSTQDASAIEREALQLLPRPGNSSAEIWRFPDKCRTPIIERLTYPVTPGAEPATCPNCGEQRLVEWDATLQQWFCAACGRTWASTGRRLARPGRTSRWALPVPRYVPMNPHVPGTIALSLFTHRGLRRP